MNIEPRTIAISKRIVEVNIDMNRVLKKSYFAPKGDTEILIHYNAEEKVGHMEIIWEEKVCQEETANSLNRLAEKGYL